MKVLKEWFITAPWGRVALISWGNPDGPPALLVHGRQDSAATFAPLLELLPETYHYVGFDIPGNGLSDPLPHGVMLCRIHFIGALELVVRLFYNAVYPNRISKLVLLDPGPSWQRLQVHDPVEYFNKQKALESVSKARGFTPAQAELEKEITIEAPWGKIRVRLVREHYRWHKFIYIGHSLGVVLAYPGHISRMVELDPVPAHDSYRPDPAVIREWYHHFYHNYYGHEQYTKLNGGGDNAPKYSFEKALEMVMKNRSLHKEAAECILERAIAPAENGLYRFTHDQRMKRVMRFPLSGNAYGAIYTASKTPTFCVLAQHSIDVGMFDQTPFVKDTNAWPNKNYSFTIVEGRHDVHISHPELMAKDISQFLLKDLKSNL
ncbi:hypothetical protein MSG28_014626 [Choristoneura fumiferana]|uniref:Uncharacterized protein n=1 Tax=Choristoneura fumiferana TaxID=7141 RepID=A0ACC0JS21_CHOFU|nr:hypothetical protein MSG28_014626 [Choristoneura fumiferana]